MLKADMHTSSSVPEQYKKHYLDKNAERLGMFQLLREKFDIKNILYPGCFTHITPSFVFPKATYVEMDRRAKRFFSDPMVLEYIKQRKSYPEDPLVSFHFADYASDFSAKEGSFDLLISQYAGFVSKACKKYLRPNGLLLVNNSHGDASMAHLAPSFVLIAVVTHNNEKYKLVENDLQEYFIPKKDTVVTKEYLEKTRKGVGYKKSGSSYIFKYAA